MQKDSILLSLKNQGARMTPTRVLLLDLLTSLSSPISVSDMLDFFIKKKKPVNKTTIYREVEFLLKKGILLPIYIDEKHTKYELKAHHHHHLVCQKCAKIEEISLKEIEDVFLVMEKKLLKKNKFKNIIHSLEFFGLCEKCS